jgi:hypothetical protein
MSDDPYAPPNLPPTKLKPCEFCSGTGWEVSDAPPYIGFFIALLLMIIPFTIGLVEIGISFGVLKRYDKSIQSVELNKDLFR